MFMKPLREGRTSIEAQATAKGAIVPENVTVGELKRLGFDVDEDWADDDVFQKDGFSPTGYAVRRKFSAETAGIFLAV